jgi:hypothetical protein
MNRLFYGWLDESHYLRTSRMPSCSWLRALTGPIAPFQKESCKDSGVRVESRADRGSIRSSW